MEEATRKDTAANHVQALRDAFEILTHSTRTLEESYRLLQGQVRELSEELAAKNRELAITNDYLNYILECMSDGVVVVDRSDTIIKFNRAASVVLGYSSEEAEGRSFAELFGRMFNASPLSGEPSLKGRSGRQVTVLERDSVISDRNDQCLGYVKVFQDLTELEALRQQVRQYDRLAAIGEMAATVAHEIRNPLGGIRGFAALLARDIAPEDPRSRLVDKILVGTMELNRVIDELLEYTRPVELHLRSVACRDIIESALSYVDGNDRGVVVRDEVPPGLKVLADPDKMRQVFLNLAINAVQSIEGQGEVRIHSEEASDFIVVHVSDTGRGISEEGLSRVFSPFFTTKEKGTGLGLAVVEKIVEGHAGKVEARSTLGKGSTFSVHLPRTE